MQDTQPAAGSSGGRDLPPALERDQQDRNAIIEMLKGRTPTHTREQAVEAIAGDRTDKINPREYAERQVASVERFLGRSAEERRQWNFAQDQLDKGVAQEELPHLLCAEFEGLTEAQAGQLAEKALDWRVKNPDRVKERSERRELEAQDRIEARQLLRDHPRDEVVKMIAAARATVADPQAYAERTVASAERSSQSQDDWHSARKALREGKPRDEVVAEIAATRKDWAGAREHAERTVGKVEAWMAKDSQRLAAVAQAASKVPPPQAGVLAPERQQTAERAR